MVIQSLALKWRLISDPDLQVATKELLLDQARFSFEQSINTDSPCWAEERINLGDDFSKLYYFPLGKETAALITQLDTATSTAMDIKPYRFEYGDEFFHNIRENIIKRFGNVACSLAYLDMPDDDGAELLVTTEHALKIANCTFSQNKTEVFPPPRPSN